MRRDRAALAVIGGLILGVALFTIGVPAEPAVSATNDVGTMSYPTCEKRWYPAGNIWTASVANAVCDLKRRFANIREVSCEPPDWDAISHVAGTVRYWSALECNGSLHVGRSGATFALRYFVTGGCDECFRITTLRGASVALLKKKPPPPPLPKTDWWWSEGTADSQLSHSLWIVRNNLDPDSVDCAGVGRTWHPRNSPILYQRFRCRINSAFGYQLWFLYQLTVTGRDRFAMKKLGAGISP